jgi:hypothetical protein
MKKTIMETLVAAVLATGIAHAAPLPLQGAVITATYNGSADAMVGLDHLFQAEPGSNTTALDPSGTGIELLSADAVFGFDFDASGLLTVVANGAVAPGSYLFHFDFGHTLAAPLTAFRLLDGGGIGGTPVLSLGSDGKSIDLDLTGTTWGEFASITAQLDAAAVPAPGSAALMLGGFAALAASRRRTRGTRHTAQD